MTNFLTQFTNHLTGQHPAEQENANGEEQNNERIEETMPSVSFPFPKCLPSISALLWELNDKLNYPPDYSFSAILFAAAIKTGNHIKIKNKLGWNDTCVIFIANVGNPNTNKSHPVSFLLKPIFEQDEASFKNYQREKRNWDSGPDKELYNKPHCVQSLASDFTPEALNYMHGLNPNGIGVYVDELAGWFKNFNRYHKGAEQEFWISAWSGKPIKINRAGSEPILIPNPFIPVIGSIQNRILEQLAKESRSESGFVDRILFAFPQGAKKPYMTDKELNDGFYTGWVQLIEYITQLTAAFDGSVCKLAPDAKTLYINWCNKNTDDCNALQGDSLSGTLGKFDVHLLRLILLVHILKMGEEKGNFSHTIEAEVVETAITLADYYKQTAIWVSNILAHVSLADHLPEDKKELYRQLTTQFKSKDALAIGRTLNMGRMTVYRFLNKKDLFRHDSRSGEFSKIL